MNETNTQPASTNKNKVVASLAIPLAIVLGFGLIAAAIYFADNNSSANMVQDNGESESEADLSALNPITEEDHIKGNPNAPIVIVEYSDFDCVFCHSFHRTLQRILDEYGAEGQVAWVYRHFPITSLHPSSAYIAEASECVAELGGDNAFWEFADLIFGERTVNSSGQLPPTDLSRLPEFASIAGVDEVEFKECLDSGRNQAKVEEDFNNAVAIGGNGTPYSVVVAGDQTFEITGGAQPYEVVKQMVDGLLR